MKAQLGLQCTHDSVANLCLDAGLPCIKQCVQVIKGSKATWSTNVMGQDQLEMQALAPEDVFQLP